MEPTAPGQDRRPGPCSRSTWLQTLDALARPVLAAAGERKLTATLPAPHHPDAPQRARFGPLEAVGRLLAGIAPWLETGEREGAEGRQRRRTADASREAIAALVAPDSPDRFDFGSASGGKQGLVDAGFLALALLRAPTELWEKLPPPTQALLRDALTATRAIHPPENNWLCFAAIIEAALHNMTGAYVPEPVTRALGHHELWYLGDGWYGDGPELHWDYYNSFVIQPMLLEIAEELACENPCWAELREPIGLRAQRAAAVLERMISPEGALPPVGRSLCYRCGSLQLLGQMALRNELPGGVSFAQVRCGMSAVIDRLLGAPGTFDEAGWLRVGFCGHQPSLAEMYIGPGSLYLCATALLPLGLSRRHEFWTAPCADWTSRRVYSGLDVPADAALPTATARPWSLLDPTGNASARPS